MHLKLKGFQFNLESAVLTSSTKRIFLFLTFFNNILSLTRIGFNLQGVARLVAPVHVARQCGHAGGPSQRYAATEMTWLSLSRHVGWRDKTNVLDPRRPPLPHPPFLSLTPPRPEQQQVVAAGRPTPQIPPNPAFWWGEVGGNVPHPSPKVLLLFFTPLSVHICRIRDSW